MHVHVCVCVIEREHLSSTLSKFQLHNTILLTVLIMFYISYSECKHARMESFYPFFKLSAAKLSQAPAPDNHFSTLDF